MEKLVEASAAEAEAVSAVWQAAKAASVDPSEGKSSGAQASDKLHVPETSSDGSETDTLEADVRLHPRAVCVFKFLKGIHKHPLLREILRKHTALVLC